jgi:hypothetical protein
VFLRAKEKPFHEIGKMLLRSIRLLKAQYLGESNESLQDVFLTLKDSVINPRELKHENNLHPKEEEFIRRCNY